MKLLEAGFYCAEKGCRNVASCERPLSKTLDPRGGWDVIVDLVCLQHSSPQEGINT